MSDGQTTPVFPASPRSPLAYPRDIRNNEEIEDANKSLPVTLEKISFLILLGLFLIASFAYQLLSYTLIQRTAAIVAICYGVIYAVVKKIAGERIFPNQSVGNLLLFAATGIAYIVAFSLQNTVVYQVFQFAAPALLMITLAIELFPFVAKGKPGEHKGPLAALVLGMVLAAFALFPGANISEMLPIPLPLFTPAVAAGVLILVACSYDYVSNYVSSLFRPAEASDSDSSNFVSPPSSPLHGDTLANRSIISSPGNNGVLQTPPSSSSMASSSNTTSSVAEDLRRLSSVLSSTEAFFNANISSNSNSTVPQPSSSSVTNSSGTASEPNTPPSPLTPYFNGSGGSLLVSATDDAFSLAQSSEQSVSPTLDAVVNQQSSHDSHSDRVSSSSSNTSSAPSALLPEHHHPHQQQEEKDNKADGESVVVADDDANGESMHQLFD